MQLRSPAMASGTTTLILLALIGLAGCFTSPTADGTNVGPTATIGTPVTSLTFRGGDSVAFSGSASDPEDGTVPPSRLTWWVDLHHDTHTHPFLDRTSGMSGKVFVPPLGHPDQDIFLRFHLEAMDADGAADTVTVDLQPARVQFTVASEPAGMAVTLDGQPAVAPYLIAGVVGMERDIGAPSPQTVGTTVYEFVDWSDGGAGVHRITTPEDSTAFVARYRALATPNQPPTITLAPPSGGTTIVGGTSVTLTATASDPDGSVQLVRFFDGSTGIGERTSPPWSISWTPTTAGTRTLTAQATDNLGSTVPSNGVSVTVTAPANQFPTVTLTSPLPGASILVNSTVSLTATASDPDGTVVTVGFYDGTTLVGSDATAPYAVQWTPASTGSRTLSARATDNQGLTGTSAGVTVTITPPAGQDTQAPTASLASPTDGATGLTGAPTFQVNAADNVGVTGVEWQVDGEAIGQATSPPFSLNFTSLGSYSTGVHVVRARARDAAGNLSSWATARVTFGGNVSLPQGFSRTTFISGLGGLGTAMAFAPDGRLFICQQDGALRVVRNGALLGTPFHTVATSANGERGLLGVAFHPDFASNGWVYVYYTTSSGGTHNRISRLTASGDVSTGAEQVLVDLPGLSAATNHNGGALHFGLDGKLYVAVGDNANSANAPSLNSVFGKMLRFNDDGSIPGDNPWFGSVTGQNRAIWARGLRNPFSFGFDYSTGTMFINDVGQGSWEEINRGRSGADYGWPATEGTSGTGGSSGYDTPVYAYGHSSNSTLVTGFAIVGAAFYRPATTLFPSAWTGHYFFGDYVSDWINRLDPANGNAVYAFARLGGAVTDLQVGPDGALYALAEVSGGGWGVYRYGRP